MTIERGMEIYLIHDMSARRKSPAIMPTNLQLSILIDRDHP